MSGRICTASEGTKAPIVARLDYGWRVAQHPGAAAALYRPEDAHVLGGEASFREDGALGVDMVEAASFGIGTVVFPRAGIVAIIRDAIARGVLTIAELTPAPPADTQGGREG